MPRKRKELLLGERGSKISRITWQVISFAGKKNVMYREIDVS